MSANIHRIDHAEAAKEEGMYLRRIIRRNKGGILTDSEVKILVVMLNLWLHHRSGPKGYIHPGRKLIARRARVTVKTVSRALDLFRKTGIAHDIKHLKGGNGRATQYRLDTREIQAMFDPSNVKALHGELVPFRGTQIVENVPLEEGQNVPLSIDILRIIPDQVNSDTDGGQDE